MQPIFEDPSIPLNFRTLQILLINLARLPKRLLFSWRVRPEGLLMCPFVFAVAV
jgi:hypothetical protein